MNEKELLKKIRAQARKDAKNRLDRRFLDAMGFLVAKGFLKVNFDVPLGPNRRLEIDDVIWAGKNVEPRILEVLPAAVLRLERHFDLDPERHPQLYAVVTRLRRGENEGEPFLGVPYAKLKVWRDFPLRDRRTKLMKEKKITKTFRLRPDVVAFLERAAQEQGCTETAILESRILGER